MDDFDTDLQQKLLEICNKYNTKILLSNGLIIPLIGYISGGSKIKASIADSNINIFFYHLCSGRFLDQLKISIKYGDEIDFEDYYGNTPLMIGCTYGASPKTIQLLIKKGKSNINYQNKEYGFTPLMGAAYAGNYEAAKILIESGADIHIKDYEGRSALIFALSQKSDSHKWIIDLLVDKGANLQEIIAYYNAHSS